MAIGQWHFIHGVPKRGAGAKGRWSLMPIEIVIEKYRWSPLDWFTSVLWTQSARDISGYVRIVAVAENGAREKVGQPMRPDEAKRIAEALRSELNTMERTAWLAKHHLRKIR
jgi:hypothetical protein